MPKRVLSGEVVSNKASKTLIVLVKRLVNHAVYKKIVTTYNKYSVHCNDEKQFAIGSVVKIRESKPFSKTKKWEVIEG